MLVRAMVITCDPQVVSFGNRRVLAASNRVMRARVEARMMVSCGAVLRGTLNGACRSAASWLRPWCIKVPPKFRLRFANAHLTLGRARYRPCLAARYNQLMVTEEL